jgi:nicotinamidase-related amidase
MKANPSRAALILIDMENGFVEPEGGHCIRFAKSTVPACVRAVETARIRASGVLRQA